MAESRILERGYRRYEGPRQSVGHAMRSTIAHTIRHVMGLHRPARYKVLPFLTLLFCYLPAIVFVGVAALLPPEASEFIPSYHEYYQFVANAVVLFAVIVVPDALCADRRSRSLSLYFSSALNRMTYLLAKFIAIMSCLLFATLGPVLLVLLGLVFQSKGPDGPDGVAIALLRIIGAATVVALACAALGMGVSSFTDRRGFASAGMFIIPFITQPLSFILVELMNLPRDFFMASFVRAQLEVGQFIFGQPRISPGAFGPDESLMISGRWGIILLAEALWILVPMAYCIHRYRIGRVTR